MSTLLYWFFPHLRAKNMAREAALRACKKHVPEEPIFSAVICADETDRYVVSVFYGKRPWSSTHHMAPPWLDCLIVAVRKDTYADEIIVDNERYYPRIR
jgi:hypothetical protein